MNAFYRATVPSNIAFLKYWGKRDASLQWPANDSLSMTLNALTTETSAKRIDGPDHIFKFEGEIHPRNSRLFAKAYKHLDRLAQLPEIEGALEISTANNFPLGAGMASSASGLGALTLAALAAWLECPDFESLARRGFPRPRLANLARLGSGSAGRSLFGGYVCWRAGEKPEAQTIVPAFPAAQWGLRDSVIVFAGNEKGISSSEAHEQAWSSPLFAPRLAGIPERLEAMEKAIQRRDLHLLGPLLEVEALEMHAVIMTAKPGHCYLNEQSLAFISALRDARRQRKIQAYFTIDAGPNIHLIHEEEAHQALLSWLETHWPGHLLLHDKVGEGPLLEYLRV